mgnify:CR=1 FL=1
MPEIIQYSAEVPSELGGQRLDQIAAQLFDEYSRSRLSSWIKDGHLTVDGAVLRPRDIVHGGAVLVLSAEQEAQGEWIAQDIELDIVYEDDQILVINKPAGLVVHPAPGNWTGTLLNGLLVTELVYYYVQLSYVLPVLVGVLFTLLHALIQAYVLTMLTALFYGEVSERPEPASGRA